MGENIALSSPAFFLGGAILRTGVQKEPPLFRRFVAVALLVSFVAMATSGLMMFVIERPSFSIQMHPVHKLFSLLMIAAATCHIILNRRPLLAHLKHARAGIFGGVLAAGLAALYILAFSNPVAPELAAQMDNAAAAAEARE